MNARKLKHNNLDIEVGQNLTLEDFLDIAYNVEDGFVTLATNAENWQESTHYIKSLRNYIELDQNVDIYTSVNTFYKDRRRVSDVRHILKFYSDLDVYEKGISKEKAIQMIDFAVEKELIPDPTFLIDSGRGLYCLWIIEDAPGKRRKVLRLYNYIQEFLSENLEDIGADKNALDVARVLRLVGSYNTKNNEQVRVIRYRKDNIYTMKYMQDFMNTVNNVNWEEVKEKIKERRKKQRQQKKKNKSSISVARLFNPYTLAIARSQDLEKICELRNYDIEGFRNQL